MTNHIGKSRDFLSNISKSTVFEILDDAEVKPQKDRYYVKKGALTLRRGMSLSFVCKERWR
jgi:hypothetical protein